MLRRAMKSRGNLFPRWPLHIPITVVCLSFFLLFVLFGRSSDPQQDRCTGAKIDALSTRLDLKDCGLNVLPANIDWCALNALTVLDLSGNDLQTLPAAISCASKISTLFLSNNPRLTRVPAVVRQLPHLKMYAQKSSNLAQIQVSDFPANLEWLILTGNVLTEIPDFSQLPIRKLMLSHNRLHTIKALPRRLELIRISNNKFTTLPHAMIRAPNLAWVAFSTNAFLGNGSPKLAVPDMALHSMKSTETLATNQGKSVIKSTVLGEPAAIKFFGVMDTDGLASNEVTVNGIIGNGHSSMINTIAVEMESKSHPAAVAFEFLKGWAPLGGRPNFDTITRDTFSPETPRFSGAEVLHVATLISGALSKLHSLGISHGDLYAHNIMAQPAGTLTLRGKVKLGDFGGSTRYPEELASQVDIWERRSYAFLLDDMLSYSQEAFLLDDMLSSGGRAELKKNDRSSSDEESNGARTITVGGGEESNGVTTGVDGSGGTFGDVIGNVLNMARGDSLVTFDALHEQLQRVAKDMVSGFSGRWHDPNHPDGWREITVNGVLLTVSGTDEKDGKLWEIPAFPSPTGMDAQTKGSSFVFDFGSKGGPVVTARYSAETNSIEFGGTAASSWTRAEGV